MGYQAEDGMLDTETLITRHRGKTLEACGASPLMSRRIDSAGKAGKVGTNRISNG